MNTILEQINSTGKIFVEFALPMLVQSGVLILILLLADFALRKKVRAVFRYWIWLLVLLKLVLPTSLSSPLSLGYFFGDELAYVDIAQITEEPHITVVDPTPASVPPFIDLTNIETYRQTPTGPPIIPDTETAVTEPINSPVVSVTPVTWQGAVFLVWLTVVMAMGLLLLQRAIFVRGLVAQAKEANSMMNDTLVHCCERMGVKRKIGLKVSANAASPAVCGLFRPVILVPQNVTSSLNTIQLRAVLLHELAHIKRGDLWVNMAQTVLQIVYFYNPLLWLANCIIRRVREQAVDEMVLVAMGEKARQYPQTLVNVAKLAFKRPALSLRLIGVVESKSALAGRIKHILNRPMPKRTKLGILGLMIIIITAAILLPMAKAERELRNPVRLDENGRPIITHTLYMWEENEKLVWQLEGETYRHIEQVVGRIKELMEEKIFPYIRVRVPEQFRSQQAPVNKLGRLCRGIGFINMEYKYDLKQPPSPFRAMLPNGVTVELVGICEHPSEGKQWWKPDGTELSKEIRVRTRGRVSTSGIPYNVAVKVTMPEDATFKWSRIEGETGGISLEAVDSEGRPISNMQALRVYIDEQLTATSIQLGAAAGPWKTRARDSFRGGKSTAGIVFSKAYESDGGVRIIVADEHLDLDYRITAIDTQGKEHVFHQRGGSAGKVRQTTALFHDIKLNQIEYFLFQTRPYQWVTFNNVSLQPGKKSDVQVESDLPIKTGLPTAIKRAEREKEPKQGFTAVLSGGVTVELVGICEHPNEGKQWWRPDGSILDPDHAPSDYSRMTVKPDETEQARELALRFAGPDVENMSFRWKMDMATRSSSHPFYVTEKREKLKPLRNIVFKLPQNLKTLDFSIGVATGEWKGVASGGDGRTMSGTNDSLTDSSVIFHEAVKEKDTVRLCATHLLGGDYDCRIMVVDRDDEIHEPIRCSNSGSDMRLCKGFFDLSADQIKYILLQARPYEWVEFKNVSLRPGHKTDVKFGIPIVEDVNPTPPRPELLLTPILGYDVKLNFADPTIRDGSFHSKQSVAFVMSFHSIEDLKPGVLLSGLLIGQKTFSLILEDNRIKIQDGSTGRKIDSESWFAEQVQFNKVITLPVMYGQKEYSCPIHVEMDRHGDGDLTGSYWFCAYLSGRLPWGAGGRSFEIVNLDQQMEFRLQGDGTDKRDAVLGIDIDGDGKINPAEKGGEQFNLYEPFQIGSKTYRVTEVDPYLPRVVFHEVSPAQPLHTGVKTDVPLGTETEKVAKTDAGIAGLNETEAREKASSFIGCDLSASVQDVKFFSNSMFGTYQVLIRFDIAPEDLKNLMKNSDKLPDFPDLHKNPKIHTAMVETHKVLKIDWWKPGELESPICAEWLKRKRAMGDPRVWLYRLLKICCSRQDNNLIRVYIDFFSEPDDLPFSNPDMKREIEEPEVWSQKLAGDVFAAVIANDNNRLEALNIDSGLLSVLGGYRRDYDFSGLNKMVHYQKADRCFVIVSPIRHKEVKYPDQEIRFGFKLKQGVWVAGSIESGNIGDRDDFLKKEGFEEFSRIELTRKFTDRTQVNPTNNSVVRVVPGRVAVDWQYIGQAIPPDFNDIMILTEHVNLGSIGQDAEGKTFITFHRDGEKTQNQQYRFVLFKKDGNILEPDGHIVLGESKRLEEKFTFPESFVPRRLKGFRFQSRPLPPAGTDNISSQLQKAAPEEVKYEKISPSGLAPPGRYAIELDGVDDYLLVPDSPSLKLEPPFTVEMWVKTKLPADASEYRGGWAVISKGFYVGTPRAYVTGFGINLDRHPEEPSKLHIDFCKANNSGTYSSRYGGYPLTNGVSEWIHITHVFDGEYYKSTPGYPLVMGKFLIPTENPLMGQLGEVRLWNGARTRQELRQYKNVALTGTEPGLAACWTFEQTEGQFAYDISGNNNHARLGKSPDPDNADPKWVDLQAPSPQPGQKIDVQAEIENHLFSVYGTVTDQSGRPIAGAQLTADCGHEKLERTGRAITDENGRYTLGFTSSVKALHVDPYDVGIQTARIEARAQGFYEASLCRQGNLAMAGKPPGPNEQRFVADYAGVVLPRKPYELNFVMHPAARIEGEFVDEQGRSILRRSVWLSGDGLLKNTSLSGLSYGNGTFTIDHVPCGTVWFTSVNRQLVQSGAVNLATPGTYRVQLQFGESPSGRPTLRIAEFQAPEPSLAESARPRVIDPNGNPVAGAQVAICTRDKGVVIRAGKLSPNRMGGRTTTILETDPDGSFDFSDRPDDFHLIVAHEKGFAWITREQFTSSPEIRLQSWGRIEGHLYIGRKSAADKKMSLLNYINKNAIDQGVRYEYETDTDAGGKFVFDKVPPGWLEIGYLTRMGNSSWSQTGRTPVQINPGVTLRVAIGGRGRPVVGKFVPPPGYDRPVYFGEGLRVLDALRPERPKPENYDRMSKRERQQWYNQWSKTPEAGAYYDAMWHDPGRRHYVFHIKKDGSFRIEDVIAGRYKLTVWIEERLTGQGRPEEIAGYYGTIEVPEIPGGRSDEPLDLGELELTMHNPLRVGDIAPLFEAKTLDGKELKLIDYRGKFVLLSFWQPVFHPELQQLRELYDTYGSDGKLEIIGLGGNDTLDEVKNYVRENAIQWPQIYTGEEFKSGIAKDYDLPGIPSIFLIDPDGRIIAKDLRGDKLKSVVSEAIEVANVNKPDVQGDGETEQSSSVGKKVTDIKLPFTFTIYTLTPDGKPQPGVKIRCVHPRPERAEPIVDMIAESDENGVATFTITKADLLTDWIYWFSLADENYVGSPEVGITPDEENWTFKVLPAEEFELQVTGDKRPVPGAKISLQVDHNKGEDWDPKRFRAYANTRSDSSGRARIKFVKGKIDMAIAAKGYASKSIRGVQLSSDKPYLIELSRGREITGRVVDPNKNPLEGVAISARKEELFHYDEEFILKASTDENGKFTLKDASPGQWEISARSEDPAKPYFIAPVTMKVRRWWPVRTIKMVAREGFRLKGKYVTQYKINIKDDGGLPWIDGFVTKPSRAWLQLRTKEDGTFDIWGFPCEGEGQIRFVGVGGYHNFIKMPEEYSFFKIFGDMIRFENVPPGTYENIEVHYLLAGMVSGTVVDALGHPFPEAEVEVRPRGGIHKTDKEGNFSIRVPPVDNTTLTVRDLTTRAVVFRSEPFNVKEGEVIEKNIKTRYERGN